jgi:putative spermidine/putrescine transport system substrate-binding protein
VNPFSARTAGVAGVLTAATFALSACGSAPDSVATGRAGGPQAATSAQDLGGMDALVAAAKKEGVLNAIAP